MQNKKYNKQLGQASRLLLILAIIVLVAVIISYLIVKMAEKPPRPSTEEQTVPQPFYEQTIGDMRFVFQEARDLGRVLSGSQSRYPQWQKDLITTERFIKVTIGAQNKGKENIRNGTWNIENIVDSEGRNYVPLDYSASAWLPEQDLCGDLLKPEFSLISCVKIYEVSKISTGLKIRVMDTSKKAEALIDLIVTN
ncbi:MAG: hypothetical protein CEN87_300 [Parcubacteria group bacterium Licking1014_1]|nr:MAG: hypothetical protein CEN87_300 [Parcubacteria group bacterium Licking1014_1]